MPTFTSAILKQTSKSIDNARASSIHDGKKSSKHGDDNDIAALIAERMTGKQPLMHCTYRVPVQIKFSIVN
jgi:hypothetical protein